MKLYRSGLVTTTFGNVSGIDRASGIVAIKPSGVQYKKLNADNMVLVDLEGNIISEAGLRPSSDTATHLELYRSFTAIGGVAHSHSRFATAFSQAKKAIPCLGTTHADYFRGEIPVTRVISDSCISSDYELETGRLIASTFKSIDYNQMRACLIASHGPFTWGTDADSSVEAAISLEHIAELAYYALNIESSVSNIKRTLLDKHYLRKHGSDSYYGQDKGK